MLLQQAMQSVGNLFGNIQPVVQTISIPQTADDEAVLPADVYEEPSVSQDKNENQAAQKRSFGDGQPQEALHGREMTEKDRAQDFCCDKCGSVIPKNVWSYSYEKMGRPLCFKCQKAFRNQQGGGRS